MSRDIFGCHSWGRGVITSTSEGKRSCYTSYNVHDGLLQQSYSAQNVNSAEQKIKNAEQIVLRSGNTVVLLIFFFFSPILAFTAYML